MAAGAVETVKQVKPSLGRIVIYHFSPYEEIDMAKNGGAEVAPAVVVRVWSDTVVNLKILTDSSMDLWKPNVKLDKAVNPRDGYWTWPERV